MTTAFHQGHGSLVDPALCQGALTQIGALRMLTHSTACEKARTKVQPVRIW